MARGRGLWIDCWGCSSNAEQSATSAKATFYIMSTWVCLRLRYHYLDIDEDHYGRLCSILEKRYRLEYTAHFDDCCKQLQRDPEYPIDSLLVSLVGIRKIAMKVKDSFWELVGNPNNQPSGGVYSIAMVSIQNELDIFMDQLLANLKWNRTWYSFGKY